MKLITNSIKFIAIYLFFISTTFSNVYWIPATEKYYKYDTTPTRTTKVYKYVSTLDIETARDTWKKLNGIYAKYTTIAGGVKYVEEVIVTQPVPIEPVCAAYKCVDSFGITYDLTKNTVLTCPMVKILKDGTALDYDGLQVSGKCR